MRPPSSLFTTLRTSARTRPATVVASPSRKALSTLTSSSSSSSSRPRQIYQSKTSISIPRRAFHPSSKRQDVFFVAFPALKSGLLGITRFSLIILPFVFRYKLWKKYKKTSWLLIQLPIFAVCVVLALGLDQSPRTGRWRLLLMSETEEMAWSRRKHQELLKNDGPLLLPPSDSRSKKISKITSRLITALEEQDHHIIHGAAWPPKSQELSRVINEREASALQGKWNGVNYQPSGTAQSSFMPFRPVTSNPLKKLEGADWNLYVIDLPQMNAFALPSKDIFVYSGLINALPDDDALIAGILAHEIAHVAQRHSVENMGFLNIAAVAFDVLRGITFALTISFPVITDSAGMCINWLNDVVAERAYSRKLEEEADAVGLELMANAGYDPRAALDIWEFMDAVEADAEATGQTSIESKIALLRTHPTNRERREAMEKDMPAAVKIYKERLGRNTNSQRTAAIATANEKGSTSLPPVSIDTTVA